MRTRSWLPALLLCLSLHAAKPLHADTLNFDDIPDYNTGESYVLGPYDGFNFYAFESVAIGGVFGSPIPNDPAGGFIVSLLYPFGGSPPYGNELPVPDTPDWDYYLESSDFSDFYSSDGSTFTLNSLDFALNGPGSSLFAILGYNNYQLADVIEHPTIDPSTGLITLNWTNIDGVVFVGQNGFFIDNVVFNEPTAPTPEPSPLILVGTSLAGLLATRRRSTRTLPQRSSGLTTTKTRNTTPMRTRSLLPALLLCLSLHAAKPLHADTLNFDDIANYSDGAAYDFPTYHGFDFYSFESTIAGSFDGSPIPNDTTPFIIAPTIPSSR